MGKIETPLKIQCLEKNHLRCFFFFFSFSSVSQLLYILDVLLSITQLVMCHLKVLSMNHKSKMTPRFVLECVFQTFQQVYRTETIPVLCQNTKRTQVCSKRFHRVSYTNKKNNNVIKIKRIKCTVGSWSDVARSFVFLNNQQKKKKKIIQGL